MSDTVDIEDFAKFVKSSLHKYITGVLLALPEVAKILAIPIIGPLFKRFIEWVVDLVLTKAGLAAFIINTKVFTQSQATDYIEAVIKLEKAPETISDEEWAALEEDANAAFTRLVRFTS